MHGVQRTMAEFVRDREPLPNERVVTVDGDPPTYGLASEGASR